MGVKMFYKDVPKKFTNLIHPLLYRQMEILHQVWSENGKGVSGPVSGPVDVDYFNNGNTRHFNVTAKLDGVDSIVYYSSAVWRDNRKNFFTGKCYLVSQAFLIMGTCNSTNVLAFGEKIGLKEICVHTTQHYDPLWVIRDFPKFKNLWTDDEDEYKKALKALLDLNALKDASEKALAELSDLIGLGDPLHPFNIFG
jgi:hypothetical protein